MYRWGVESNKDSLLGNWGLCNYNHFVVFSATKLYLLKDLCCFIFIKQWLIIYLFNTINHKLSATIHSLCHFIWILDIVYMNNIELRIKYTQHNFCSYQLTIFKFHLIVFAQLFYYLYHSRPYTLIILLILWVLLNVFFVSFPFLKFKYSTFLELENNSKYQLCCNLIITIITIENTMLNTFRILIIFISFVYV